jgi:hypothetical protein
MTDTIRSCLLCLEIRVEPFKWTVLYSYEIFHKGIMGVSTNQLAIGTVLINGQY